MTAREKRLLDVFCTLFGVLPFVFIAFLAPTFESFDDAAIPLIVAAVLALMAFAFRNIVLLVVRMVERGAVPPDAPLAVGVIRGVRKTLTEINGVPRYVVNMDVRTSEGTEFAGNLETTVARGERDEFQVGRMMPVTHHPTKPHKLGRCPAERLVEARAVMEAVRIRMGLEDGGTRDISDRGVATRGVVMATVPTGQLRDGHTEVDVTVRFPLPDGTLVDRRCTSYVSHAYLDRVRVGSQVDITYLPHDDSRVVLRPFGVA